MDWNKKRVLITGAGGFIGSHLTERMVELGAATRAFVHYNAQASWGWLNESPYKKDIEAVAGDICDRDSVQAAMKGVDIVFHLAALIAIPYSYHAPVSYIRTNVEGSLNIFQAARAADVERVVHTSTSEVYGTAQYVPINENHPLQGQSPYSASKIGADKIGEAFHLSFNLPLVILRPFNTFGPRQSARAIIPAIITQSLAGEAIKLGNIHPKRDFNYISNTVDGFVLAATASDAVGWTINLGFGQDISIKDLVELIGRLIGRNVEIETDSVRIRPKDSEVERLLADNSRAEKILNWRPKVSFEEGLRLTIDWITKNAERYRPNVYAV